MSFLCIFSTQYVDQIRSAFLNTFLHGLLEVTHPGRQALLERGADGEAAVVEVADELRVDGAAELSLLPVGRGDEDPLDTLHHDVVEQRVLCSRGQSVTTRRRFLASSSQHVKIQEMHLITHFMVLYISSVSCSVRVFFRVPRKNGFGCFILGI